jgi:tetratricopeptide (TPR) repeat protein
MDVFYGRGWLITHYLSFDRDRFIKFQQYLKAINSGVPGVKAAEQAFGDLKALDKELGRYLRQSSLPGLPMRFDGATVPPVTIRRLSAGEAALIDERMTSVRGVNREGGRKLFEKAAPIAARYPDDSVVQGWLAEMAYDAGDFPAALAAADRALARDPKSVQALLYRGMTKLRQVHDAKSKDTAAWAEARRAIVAANRADPDDAEPLWWFWQSFGMQGIDPTFSAIAGLHRAQELAPQDESVRFAAAMVRLKAEELPQAKRLLRPIAYRPHAPADNPASRMVAALDAGKKGAEVMAIGAAAMIEKAIVRESGE